MTREQAKNKLGVSFLEEGSLRCELQLKDICETFSIKSYSIGSSDYDVYLTFVNNQLFKITIECFSSSQTKPLKSNLCFENYSYLLTQKYGYPSIDTKEIKDFKKITDRIEKYNKEWLLENQKITLKYNDYGYEGGSLFIFYEPNPNIFKINTELYESAKDKI